MSLLSLSRIPLGALEQTLLDDIEVLSLFTLLDDLFKLFDMDFSHGPYYNIDILVG